MNNTTTNPEPPAPPFIHAQAENVTPQTAEFSDPHSTHHNYQLKPKTSLSSLTKFFAPAMAALIVTIGLASGYNQIKENQDNRPSATKPTYTTQQSGIFKGIVVNDRDQTPLTQSQIRLIEPNSPKSTYFLETTTDENGNYFIEAPAQDYLISIKATGYTPYETTVTIYPQTTTIQNFSLSPL